MVIFHQPKYNPNQKNPIFFPTSLLWTGLISESIGTLPRVSHPPKKTWKSQTAPDTLSMTRSMGLKTASKQRADGNKKSINSTSEGFRGILRKTAGFCQVCLFWTALLFPQFIGKHSLMILDPVLHRWWLFSLQSARWAVRPIVGNGVVITLYQMFPKNEG